MLAINNSFRKKNKYPIIYLVSSDIFPSNCLASRHSSTSNWKMIVKIPGMKRNSCKYMQGAKENSYLSCMADWNNEKHLL